MYRVSFFEGSWTATPVIGQMYTPRAICRRKLSLIIHDARRHKGGNNALNLGNKLPSYTTQTRYICQKRRPQMHRKGKESRAGRAKIGDSEKASESVSSDRASEPGPGRAIQGHARGTARGRGCRHGEGARMWEVTAQRAGDSRQSCDPGVPSFT
jgi:hypothetical protein